MQVNVVREKVVMGLLEMIINLCFMQANVVAMLMTASHILDKLNVNMASMCANIKDHSTNTPPPAPLVSQPVGENYLTPLEQVKPAQLVFR